jgi:hypothetical protein
VSLSVGIHDTSLQVEDGTLGTRLIGGFDLRLELGSEAPSASTVSIESFALVRASDQSTLVAPLPAAPAAGFQFPLDIPKGAERVVPFVLDDQTLLDSAVRDGICAEPVQVVGVIHDSGEGGTLPVASTELTPTGC